MKPFSQWLTDMTEDLREVSNEPAQPKEHTAIDYNAIHAPLIGALKSVAWRAQNNLPMESRIETKIDLVLMLSRDIRNALNREVKTGLRSLQQLDEYDQRVERWITALQDVMNNCFIGDIPKWDKTSRYTPWKIEGL